MEAKVENREGIFIINLSGQMDFESADSLKNNCLKNFSEKDVIISLRELSFVGSSGITPFLELLTEMSKSLGPRFKMCSVGNEFLRLFESGEVDGMGIEIYRDVTDAEKAFRGQAEVQAIARVKPFGLKLSID